MIFWIGALIFAISSLIFGVIENRNQSRQFLFNSNVFVSFFTTISYVVMALALATVSAENGEPVYWTRWLFYIGSCSILTFEMATIAKKPNAKKVEISIFTALTMFCGFLASIIPSVDRWWFFGLSTVAYVVMLYNLFKANNGDGKSNINSIMWFVLFSWSLFPLVWLLAPTGFEIIAVDIEAILYLTLDIITKIAFGIYVTIKY